MLQTINHIFHKLLIRPVHTHESQTPSSEEGRDSIFREFAEISLHDVCSREFCIVTHYWIASNGIQDFF